MKHRFFCFLIVCIFTVSTAQTYTSVGAAELWNKKSHTQKSGKTYFNKSKTSKKRTHALFNHKGASIKREKISTFSSRGGSGYGFYTEIRMSEQKSSKLWKVLSPASLHNRQNDLDFALQQEYTILKKIAIEMNRETKKQKQVRYQNHKKHQRRVAQYKIDRVAAKLNEEKRRDIAYAKITKNKWSGRKVSSRHGGYKPKTKRSSTGLKKPTKLFNGPGD